MKWRELTPYVAISDKGYRVAKFIVGSETIYRASIGGRFIGSTQETFENCRQVCENNYQIMGDQDEASDSAIGDTKTA